MTCIENKEMLLTEDVEKIAKAEEIHLEGLCREESIFSHFMKKVRLKTFNFQNFNLF